MLKKVKSFVQEPSKKGKVAVAMSVMLVMTAFCSLFAFAAPGNNNVDMAAIIGQILGIICDIFLAIGVLLAAWAIGMLVLAFKNEDADSKSRAMMMLIVAVALIGAETLIDLVISATGTGFTIGTGLF